MKIPTSQDGSKNFDRPHIEEGFYEAVLKEVKEVSDGEHGKRVAFIFVIQYNHLPVELAHIAYVPECATPENKFGKALIAFGCDLGKEVNTDSLVGSTVKAMVEEYEYEKDKKKILASSISKLKPLAVIEKVE